MKLEDISAGDEVVYKGALVCIPYSQVLKIEQDPRDGKLFFRCASLRAVHYVDHDNIADLDPFIVKRGGWIGVDLDGTLAVYDKWRGPEHIGEPIPAMVSRVKKWLAEGRDVRIFTARVTDTDKNDDGTPHDIGRVRDAISDWCTKHLGGPLRVTNVKDWNMVELWDDRAVQVVPNTGRTLAEEHEAIRSADEGKAASANV